MEWFTNLAGRWRRVLIALLFILLLVGIQMLREMIQTEEGDPGKEKGTAIRYLFRSLLEKVETAAIQDPATA